MASFFVECPKCTELALSPLQKNSRCEACSASFIVMANCPDCAAALERILGCGTTTFMCNSCNLMVSKREASYSITLSEVP